MGLLSDDGIEIVEECKLFVINPMIVGEIEGFAAHRDYTYQGFRPGQVTECHSSENEAHHENRDEVSMAAQCHFEDPYFFLQRSRFGFGN